jgi:hypothetical protein
MSDHLRDVSSVSDYLVRHRYIPPERDGWFSMIEISEGIRVDTGTSFRSSRVLRATEFLMNVEPPAIEDTWMMSRKDHMPILDEQYTHPDLPKRARRFYRALGNATDFVIIEAPSVTLT